MLAQDHDIGRGAREEHRNAESGEGALADGRDRRGLRGRVIPGEQDDTAGGVRPVGGQMPQGVGGAVDPGSLAVPDPDDAGVARRVCDELAYAPGSRRKDVYPGVVLFFNEEITVGSVTTDTVLSLRPEIAKALEILKW